MNKKIGVYGSIANFIAVLCFALSMLFGFQEGSYFSSMFIAFSFVLMMCGYADCAEKDVKAARYVSGYVIGHIFCGTDYQSTDKNR